MATNLKIITDDYIFVGQGVPETTDLLTQDIVSHPIESLYFDRSTGTSYVRKAVNKLGSDWQSGSGGSGGGGTVLQSPDNTLWLIGVNDSGALQTTQVASGTPGTLSLFSPDNTEWSVTVNNSGALITTAI